MLMPEVLERVVRSAVRAPSLHNTQPWEVDVGHEGDRGWVDVRLDPARSLRHSDPLDREATIGCGALVDHLVVAARREGLDVETKGPVPGRWLARVLLTRGAAPSVAEIELSVAAVHRRSARTALDDLPVDAALVDGLVRVVADARAHLLVLPPRSAAGDVVLRQVARAEALATEDLVGLAEEEAWWGRASGLATAAPRADGVPVEEPWAGHPGAALGPGSRRFADRYPSPRGAAEHRAVLALLTTPADQPGDWLTAGQALSRLLLAATVGGLTASFATTVLENPTTRHEVVRSLGLVGAPQVLLQLGYGEPGARTARRPAPEPADDDLDDRG